MQELYSEISTRTGGDIYIGVVGPVRTGKSTLIKKIMELMILPHIDNDALRMRTRDELPQSAAGRTIMTTEPKFIPETAIQINLEKGGSFRTRLIDCVGYMVEGAMGHEENEKPRMVKSPWFEEGIPFDKAAAIGTHKVIKDHSTIGIVVTTDGSISDIPRVKYEPAEEQVVAELEQCGKPYVIVLNSMRPDSPDVQELAKALESRYGRAVIAMNCLEMTQEDTEIILQDVLKEFPVKEIDFAMPRWISMLEPNHWLQKSIYGAAMDYAETVLRMKDIREKAVFSCEHTSNMVIRQMDLATGKVVIGMELKPGVFYQVLSEETGLSICDETSLMPCIIELTKAKRAYEKVRSALEQVEATGYGIVMPSLDELNLEEPQVMHQGGRYGVRLRASAPSIQMLKTNIHTEIEPIVGTEMQSKELIKNMLQDYESDPLKIWQSNIFGKSLHELVNEGLQNKLLHMPQEARGKLQETLEKVINDGCSGLICIIL